MFTADNARNIERDTFDRKIEELVRDARPRQQSYYNVYWEDGQMAERANRAADMLKERGFKVTAITDLDSFRFAEVHFSWADDDSGDKV